MQGVDSRASGEQSWRSSIGCGARTGFRVRMVRTIIWLFDVLTHITPDTLGGTNASYDDSHPGELCVDSTTPRHFKPLSGITSLTLDNISFTLLDFPTLQRSFCNLVPTLRSLRLLYPTACPHTLFRFISMFSELQDTAIHSPSWEKPSDAPIGSFSQRHSELCISGFDDGSVPFLSLLESQATGYKRLTIRECSFDDVRPLQSFVSANGRSIRKIQIVVAEHGEHYLPTFAPPISKAHYSGGVPLILLHDCLVLEQICVSDIRSNTSFSRISSILSSVTSSRFRELVLKLQATSHRESDATQIDLVDGISYLDEPLSHLARAASEGNLKVSLVLVGQDPEFLAQGLIDFHKLGYIWAGEEIGGGDHSWTLSAPKKRKGKRFWTFILNTLLGRGNLD